MNAWKVIVATLVIFASGVLAGGLLVSHFRPAEESSPSPAPPDAQEQTAPWQMQRMDFLRRIERRLDLTPEQRERIENILRESQERTRVVWEEMGPQLREELRGTREQIRAELTPEQQEKFDEVLKHRPPRGPGEPREERRRRMGEPDGDPRPPRRMP